MERTKDPSYAVVLDTNLMVTDSTILQVVASRMNMSDESFVCVTPFNPKCMVSFGVCVCRCTLFLTLAPIIRNYTVS